MNAELKGIPKLELHCHLDGSVSLEYLEKQSQQQGIPIQMDKVTVDQHCQSLAEYLQSFDEILKVMQTRISLIDGVVDVAEQAVHDGVKYIEIRFAPAFHQGQGLEIDEILTAVCKGASLAEQTFGIKVRMLVCGMKHHSDEMNQAIFDSLRDDETLEAYIVGVDLAGDEAASPTTEHEALIQYAQQQGLNITLHAGECGCAKNVYDAVRFGAQRIGHGVAALQDEDVLATVKAKDVLLEFCPKSNLQTKAIKSLDSLDLQRLLKENIAFLINTDNRTVTQTNLLDEYALLLEHKLLNWADIVRINFKAIDYTFANSSTKQWLKQQFEVEAH
ncbi:TPA: adenosine deaminase [Staphylococcus pseudintermedius]|uniref:adenosine deaminase n=1 Tax=Staphylococcus pseudintermedius TaxID=283734 RepID=UPI0028885002|nr:adenosine deaminase [Staphylococcus pseudintermedius]MDT0785426.1 adenosine deaminase [Staphylococcus pseudintermedius]HAR6155346.1 adenosine deaminase [Staphylococcus pseudintermedius]